MSKALWVMAVGSILAGAALAQPAVSVADIVAMKAAGVSDADIQTELTRRNVVFGLLDPADVRRLKDAGVGAALQTWIESGGAIPRRLPDKLPAGPVGPVPAWPNAGPAKAPLGVAEVIALAQGKTAAQLVDELLAPAMQFAVGLTDVAGLVDAGIPVAARLIVERRSADAVTLPVVIRELRVEALLHRLFDDVGAPAGVTPALALDLVQAGAPPAIVERLRAGRYAHAPRVRGVAAAPDGEGIAAFVGRRSAATRQSAAVKAGFSQSTEAAVERALLWLARHQEEGGSWKAAAFDRLQYPADAGRSKMTWVDPGVTGLALLAFLGAGHIHGAEGDPYAATVERALAYVLASQEASGQIGTSRGHPMYNHAITTLALVEAYAFSRDGRLRDPANRALRYLAAARNPDKAWRYRERDGDNDMSVTSWCLQAIHVGRLAGLEEAADARATDLAMRFIESITDGAHGITGYKARPPQGYEGKSSSRFQNEELAVNTSLTHAINHTPTAIAVHARHVFGTKAPAEVALNLRAMASIATCLPSSAGNEGLSTVDYYYWYHGSLALFEADAPEWKPWCKAVVKVLMDGQSKTGALAGSWAADDAWGFGGGRVYATAINALTLETGYRYPRTPQKNPKKK